MSYALYYQATIDTQRCWFFVAVLRSFEHIAFDRTLDVAKSIFEFSVPADMEPYFVQVMHALAQEGVVKNFEKLPNRFEKEIVF